MRGRSQNKARLVALASVIAGALYIAAPANAALLIGISDSTDGGSASATNGAASTLPSTSFSMAGGALGAGPDVSYSTILASSDSPGTSGGAQVTLSHVKLTNLSSIPQTISITVADTDYNAPGGPGSTLSLFGTFSGTPDLGNSGLSSGTASMSSYADPLDGANASTSPIVTTTVTSTASATSFSTITGSFAGATPVATFTRANAGGGLYSLAGVTTVTLAAGSVLDLNNDTVTFASTVVPEPTSLAMFAAGSVLLMRRRRAGAR
jgi:hypothetical protein